MSGEPWPTFATDYVERAQEFRGLWFSRVKDETRWTVTFRRSSDGEIVETDYFDHPVKAITAAIHDRAAWGDEERRS